MGIPVYWIGSYLDLEMQDFLLELYQSSLFGVNNKRRGEFRTTLSAIAQVRPPHPTLVAAMKPLA